MKELSLLNCRLDRRYDIHEQLGRGSYAEVYLANDTLASPQSPHSKVVIKALNVFLQDELDADLERTLVENFQNEAVALDRVRHPNVISRIGHGTARDLNGMVFHYLVLEYMAGGDLQNLVRREKIQLKDGLRYIEQVCAGLGHAHERGIIHRDIKPHNLLLNADHSTVKIADFGVARVTAGESPITRVGTNIYAPPEHSPLFSGRGNEMRLTPAADIYSLAKSSYTILTGESPRAFANEEVTTLPDACSDEPWCNEFLRVVRKATAEDPSARQQTVDEFWNDLAAVRAIADDIEVSTVVHVTSQPQARVSRGYSPLPPQEPEFELMPTRNSARLTQPTFTPPAAKYPAIIENRPAPQMPVAVANTPVAPQIPVRAVPAKRKKRKLRRLAAFAGVILAFTGILYGTGLYVRSLNILPDIRNPFKAAQVGVANTDINLRSGPNTDSDPIGLVTKNSKVRVVTTRDNWYQVDVIEQGRARPQAASVTRGWLNGKYLDFTQN